MYDPNDSSSLEGEVKGKTIYIYSKELGKAIATLKHELLDYTVSKLIEPYQKITNTMIALINDDCYKRKEVLVDGLSKLL